MQGKEINPRKYDFMIELKTLNENSDYQIGSDGNLYYKNSLVNDRRVWSQNGRYLVCSIPVNGVSKIFKMHRLVATYFIPNYDNKPIVNHKDGNTTHNEYTNLEWATYSENTNHAISTGLINRSDLQTRMKYAQSMSPASKPGYINKKSWKPIEMYDLQGNLIKSFDSVLSANEAMHLLGAGSQSVSDMLRGHNKTVLRKYVFKYKEEI